MPCSCSAASCPASTPITDRAARIDSARKLVAERPDFVPDEWVEYRTIPDSVDFWQAERERDQVRLLCRSAPYGWAGEMLSP